MIVHSTHATHTAHATHTTHINFLEMLMEPPRNCLPLFFIMA